MTKGSVEPESLEALAERIVQKANDADDRTIEAAMLVRQARARVGNGEAGNVKWYEWAPKNIDLKKTRLRELQRIAEADDPRQELERQRKLIRERVENHRQKKKAEQPAPLRNGGAQIRANAEIETDRQRLIAWAQAAPLEQIQEVLSFIERFEPAEADAHLVEPAAPAAA